jgi:hypothetical protein
VGLRKVAVVATIARLAVRSEARRKHGEIRFMEKSPEG